MLALQAVVRENETIPRRGLVTVVIVGNRRGVISPLSDTILDERPKVRGQLENDLCEVEDRLSVRRESKSIRDRPGSKAPGGIAS